MLLHALMRFLLPRENGEACHGLGRSAHRSTAGSEGTRCLLRVLALAPGYSASQAPAGCWTPAASGPAAAALGDRLWRPTALLGHLRSLRSSCGWSSRALFSEFLPLYQQMKLLCSRPSQPGPRRWIKSFWPRTACSSFPHAHQVPSTTSASKPPLSSNLYKSLVSPDASICYRDPPFALPCPYT